MFVDSLGLDPDTSVRANVVVIGAGVAGITLAMELERHGIDTIVLESGGRQPDAATRDLNRGHSVGLPYRFADGCRSRYLGGSSNCWGGWCRPFDDWDFENRHWVANSGWPISADDLRRYYPRTHDYLQLGPYNYDTQHFEEAIAHPRVRRMPLPSGRLWDPLSQFSPPVRMGQAYEKALGQARHIRVFLHANVTNLRLGTVSESLEQVCCQTLGGNQFNVIGNIFVLAAGGIENPRLMLAANSQRPAGLGNENDLVGRYFMDHPRSFCGQVHLAENWRRNMLFDAKHHIRNAAVSAYGTCVAAALAPTRETQEREGILNSRVWFHSMYAGDGSDAYLALSHLKHRQVFNEPDGISLYQDLSTLARHPIDTAAYITGKFWRPQMLLRRVTLQGIVEPEPDRNCRVRLSQTDKDALGMPRVEIDWRLSAQTRRTFDRSFAIVAEELALGGVGQVDLGPQIEHTEDAWPELDPRGTWHHMGATRMHDAASSGVVDRNCRVHSVGNLYVAGSSVFTTGAANLPTQTIVALTLRLSDHLVDQVRKRNLAETASSIQAIDDDQTGEQLPGQSGQHNGTVTNQQVAG